MSISPSISCLMERNFLLNSNVNYYTNLLLHGFNLDGMPRECNSALLEYGLGRSLLCKNDISELHGFIPAGLDLDGALMDEHELDGAPGLEKASE